MGVEGGVSGYFSLDSFLKRDRMRAETASIGAGRSETGGVEGADSALRVDREDARRLRARFGGVRGRERE